MSNLKNKKMEPRRSTRCHIFNIIFQLEFLCSDSLVERMETYFNTLQEEEELEIKQNERYVPYLINQCIIEKEIRGILENIEYIDEKISKYSIRWKTERMNKVDLSILRLSIYEIFFEEDIPNVVAINEAIELAKAYSLENSYKFINGILAKVTKETT